MYEFIVHIFPEQVKKEKYLASGFLKKRKEGLFIFYFKMAAFLFKMSNIHRFSTAQTHNKEYINETFWSSIQTRHSDCFS